MRKSLMLMLTFLMSIMCVQSVYAQTAWTQGVEVSTGDYYIFNIGAQRFLARGSAWDTHAIVDGGGAAITIGGSNDAYTLHFPGIDSSKFLANEGYTDAASNEERYTTFSFEPAICSGYSNVYKVKANNGGNYYYWNGDNYDYKNEALCGEISNINEEWTYWILIPKNIRESADEANASNPVDVTYLVNDPDLERRDNSQWGTGFNFNVGSAAEFTVGGFLEKWAGQWVPDNSTTGESPYPLKDFSASQALRNLPAGKYVLTMNANAYCQDDASIAITGVSVYVGNDTKSVPSSNNGLYSFTFVSDGSSSVEVGIKTENTTANWVYLDNVRLTYYGPVALQLPNDNTTLLVEGQWYYYDAAKTGQYTLEGDVNNIVYTQNGDKLLDENAQTKQAQSELTFNAGRIYFKPTTSGTTLKISNDATEGKSDTFTICTLNVDGLPSLINSDGPGSSGTRLISQYLADKNYDFIGVQENFDYNSQLISYLTNYDKGTYRGSVNIFSLFSAADTDGLNFYWNTSNGRNAWNESWTQWTTSASTEGNQYIKKGYRYYEVQLEEGMMIDVYVMHMDAGDTSDSRNAQWNQLATSILNDNAYPLRPKVVIGDTNSRWTREAIKSNFVDPLSTCYDVKDAWVEFGLDGDYDEAQVDPSGYGWGYVDASNPLDYSKYEVVDKIMYLNPKDAHNSMQLEALDFQINQDYTYGYVNGTSDNTALGDHKPLVVTFKAQMPAFEFGQTYERWTWLPQEKVNSTPVYLYNVGQGQYTHRGFLNSDGYLKNDPNDAFQWYLWGDMSATDANTSISNGDYRLHMQTTGTTASIVTGNGATSFKIEDGDPTTGAYKFSCKLTGWTNTHFFNADGVDNAFSASTSKTEWNDWYIIRDDQKAVYDRYVDAWYKGEEYLLTLPLTSEMKEQMQTLLQTPTNWTMNTTSELEALNAAIESWFDDEKTDYILNPSFELANATTELGNQSGTNLAVFGWNVPTDAAEAFAAYVTDQNDIRYFINMDGSHVYNTWGGSPAQGFYCEQTISGLPEGFYKLKAICCSDPENNVVTLKMGNNSVNAKVAKKNNSTVIELPIYYHDGESEVTIGAYSDSWFEIDDFRLYRYDYYYDETVTTAEYATTAIRYNTNIPAGVDVYYVSALNKKEVTGGIRNTMHLERYDGNKLKAEEGVVLYVEGQPIAKQYRFYRTNDDVSNIEGNKLHGTSQRIEANDLQSTATYYMLAKKNIDVDGDGTTEPTVGFFRLNTGVAIKANKAYIMVDSSNELAAKTLYFFDFEDSFYDPTAIDTVGSEDVMEVIGIYSVSGARQDGLQKGVNLLRMSDGTVKKVLVK